MSYVDKRLPYVQVGGCSTGRARVLRMQHNTWGKITIDTDDLTRKSNRGAHRNDALALCERNPFAKRRRD